MNTIEPDQGRRGARALKPQEDRKSATVKFRIRDDLRAKLDKASELSGRPVSEEAELRLNNSFIMEPFNDLVLNNGKDLLTFANNILTIAKTIQDYENPKGTTLGSQDWKQSDGTRLAMREALRYLINEQLPQPPQPEDWGKPYEELSERTRMLLHMREFGKLLGQAWTGQVQGLVEEMVRRRDPEH